MFPTFFGVFRYFFNVSYLEWYILAKLQQNPMIIDFKFCVQSTYLKVHQDVNVYFHFWYTIAKKNVLKESWIEFI